MPCCSSPNTTAFAVIERVELGGMVSFPSDFGYSLKDPRPFKKIFIKYEINVVI